MDKFATLVNAWSSFHDPTSNDSEFVCGHHRYSSIRLFVDKIQSVHEKYRTNRHISEEIHDEQWDLIGNKLCKNCCLFIVTNFSEITRYDNGADLPAQKCKIIAKYVSFKDMEIMGIYFSHCLHYHLFADVIFNQSRLWSAFILSLNGSMICVEKACEHEIQRRHNHKLSKKRIISYEEIARLLDSMARNFDLFHTKLWTVILSDKFTYLAKWLPFITKQIRYGLYTESPFGLQCLCSFQALICFAIHQIQIWQHKNKKNYNCKRNFIKMFDVETIQKWIHNLQQIYQMKLMKNGGNDSNYSIEESAMMAAIGAGFNLLGDVSSAREIFDSFSLESKQMYKEKRNNLECQSIKCKIRRSDKKMYKCKACRIIRYCSKKCQKYDWNKNNHKIYCKKLRKMKRQRLKSFCDCQQHMI